MFNNNFRTNRVLYILKGREGLLGQIRGRGREWAELSSGLAREKQADSKLGLEKRAREG
jgi:hypothetical protein